VGVIVPTLIAPFPTLLGLCHEANGWLLKQHRRWCCTQVLSLERNLIRDVSDDIGQLSGLTSLSLAGNDSMVAVPSSVGELVQLRRLTLRSTRVRSLPGAVSDLRRRITIDIDDGDDDDDDDVVTGAGGTTSTGGLSEHIAD